MNVSICSRWGILLIIFSSYKNTRMSKLMMTALCFKEPIELRSKYIRMCWPRQSSTIISKVDINLKK